MQLYESVQVVKLDLSSTTFSLVYQSACIAFPLRVRGLVRHAM